MDRTPNAERVRAGCASLMEHFTAEILSERLTDAEVLGCAATVLGILLAHTDLENRAAARKMAVEVIDTVINSRDRPRAA